MLTRTYLFAVPAVGGLLLLSAWLHATSLTPGEAAALVMLIATGVLAHSTSLSVRTGIGQTFYSVIFVPLLASVLILPPHAALLVAGAVMVITELAVLRKPWERALFNTGMAICATAVAINSMQFFASRLPEGASWHILGFFIASFGFFFTNALLVGAYHAISSDAGLIRAVSRVVGGGGTSLIEDLVVSPIALVVELLFTEAGIVGLAVGLFPLVLIRHAYISIMQVQKANRDVLKVLIKTIETRDAYTSGHSIRVSLLARTMAEDLGLKRVQVERVETAALLHDVGKIDEVYAEIIRKPHNLSDVERSVIRSHAERGAEFLKSLSSFSSEVVESVRHHHERFDGRGYPLGLKGTQIPLAARIIMVSDAIDAMLSDRPYRAALQIEHVEDELRVCSGRQFDPKIVEMILSKETLLRAVDLIAKDAAAEHPHIGSDLRVEADGRTYGHHQSKAELT